MADLPEDWQRRQPPQPDEQALPPRARLALELRYDGDFSLRDIAAMLGMREGALRVTVHRALAQLRQRIVSDAAASEPQATRCEEPSGATSTRATHASI